MTMRKYATEDIFPVYAQGYFVVCRDGLFQQVIVFDYYDPMHIYSQLSQDEEALKKELDRLTENMQSYLDEEEIYVNNVRVEPRVKSIDLTFRGTAVRPSIVFTIVFRGQLHKGENVYEDYYEREVLEYDYEAYWIFPEGTEILEVRVDTGYDVVGNRVIIWGRKGDEVKGYEMMKFIL